MPILKTEILGSQIEINYQEDEYNKLKKLISSYKKKYSIFLHNGCASVICFQGTLVTFLYYYNCQLLQKYCCCDGDMPFCRCDGWKVTLVGSRFTHPKRSRHAPIKGGALAVADALE